jgi:glycosyltransferase involved in cell wall biosynthesis
MKLLSITIPTWNRAKTLDKALSKLLPQVSSFSEYIEVVISDNNSQDYTKEIIRKWTQAYDNIDFIIFFQKENTGFFGNFKKCKELANAKYIWILSDDDFVQDKLIQNIIHTLNNSDPDLGMLYLETIIKRYYSKIEHSDEISIFDLFNRYNYQLTLTSSVIFINNKENDKYIFKTFFKSNLIGFALLVDVIRYNKTSKILKGNLLSIRMDEISGYNLFDVFIYELSTILTYMVNIGYPDFLINKFKNSILRYILLKRYFYLKAKGKIDAKLETYSLNKVNKILWRQFKNTRNYWVFIFPVRLIPPFLIKITFPLIDKIRKTLK